MNTNLINKHSQWRVLTCAGLVVAMALGTRHVQGLFLLPILADKGWGRETFAFAFGLQTLVWGLLQPITGALTDRFGTSRVAMAGCAVYALGLLIESVASSPGVLTLGIGVLLGAGLTAMTFSTVYGGLARMFPPNRRGWAQGIAGAIGGFAQFLMVPAVQTGIGRIGWSITLQFLAVLCVACIAAAYIVDDRTDDSPGRNTSQSSSMAFVVKAALKHPGFWLLNLGFTSCGFQLAFLGIHLPAYLKDAGMTSDVGVTAIALIAISNAIGTFVCGRLGDLYRRKYLLSIVYTIRSLAIILFLAVPLSQWTVYLFAVGMGLTWLGTVPLTSGVVGEIFGVKYIGTLFGLVFVGHQLGGFFGSWIGGYVYDTTHSYNLMWTISLVLGVASIIFNLPINDKSVESEWVSSPVRAI